MKMVFKARSVISEESTQSVPNFTSFFKLLKEFRFLKEVSVISLIFIPYNHSSA